MSGLIGHRGLLLVAGAPSDTGDLLDRMRNGEQSAELFTRANGVNEFELLWVEGNYYMYLHDYSTSNVVQVRKASTIAGLSSASEVSTGVTGGYPTVYFDGSSWHLFVWTGSTTKRYTAASGDATSWTFAQDVGAYADFHVRQNPADGVYWAAYKETSGTKRAGIATCASIDGTWTDQGYVFSTLGRAPWHSQEEADGVPVFHGGNAFLGFAGFDGARQRIAMVELDASYKAVKRPIVLVEPLLSWQQRGGSYKVFSPVYVQGDPAGAKLYFAHNPGATGITTGWAYIAAGDTPSVARADDLVVSVDYENTIQDEATGIVSNVWGDAVHDGTPPTAYLDTTTGSGGAFGWLNRTSLSGAFTIDIEFQVTTAPSSGAYMRLFRVGPTDSGANPIAAMWLKGTGSSKFQLYCEVRDPTNSINFVSTGSSTTLGTDVRYSARLQRVGDVITMYLNDVSQASGSFDGALTGAVEWTVATKFGSSGSGSDGQQFRGRVYTFGVLGA